MNLIDFLKVYNFRDSYSDDNGNYIYDTKIIRIKYDFPKWIEFGVNNWDDNYSVIDIVSETLNSSLLYKEVTSIRELDNQVIEISLTGEK